MSGKNRNHIFVLIMAMICIIALLTCACGRKDRVYPESIDELNGLRAGCVTGTIYDQVIRRKFPDSEIVHTSMEADLIAELENNKIDYFTVDKYKVVGMMKYSDDIRVLDGVVDSTMVGYAFPKDSQDAKFLRVQIDEFIEDKKADGTIDELEQKWCLSMDAVDNAEPIDYPKDGENGIIKMAASSTAPPFTYVAGYGYSGFDVEFIAMFCREYGYGLQIVGSDFSAIVPAIVSGKADFGASSLSITKERMENVVFSDSYLRCDTVAVVAKEKNRGLTWESVKRSFNRTFVIEDRWKMILDGMCVTINIFLGSALCGTLLGFAIYLLCSRGNKVINGFFDTFSWIISGLPMVMVLLVLFYIVFGHTRVSGRIVATIAFTITVMMSVYSLLKTSVKAIGNDQIEGAYSLGYTNIQTFFKIILPQAMQQFIPNYSSMLTGTLKGTSIVGYVAVRDLTKVSDVIRSRTFEPFFPIVVTAIMYLLLVKLLTHLINVVERRIDPRNRTEEKILEKFNK